MAHTGTKGKFRLDNKVAIIYGGSYGIGKAISSVFSEAGATVVIVSRDEKKGEAAVDSLCGKEKIYIQGDVRNYTDHENVVQKVLQNYRKIDIVVCCAGIYTPLREISDPEYNEKYISHMIDVNLKGSIYAVKTTVEHLKKSDAGRIIFISSITGIHTGMPGFSVYGATKAAQVGYAHSAAVELAPFKITVNSVLPGNTLTEELAKIGEEYLDEMKKATPLKRLGAPEEIGNAVLFLASSEASFITGQEIVVDGGQIRPEGFV